ncbi:MAG: NADPH-dependent FMN reductase [Comamonadaceae bacterium]
MTVLLVAGSPSEHSRSAALLDAAQQRLRLRGVAVERLQIRDLNAQALLLADASHPTLARAVTQVARARAIVVATPVYKAAYSGVLKVFLDLLAQTAFKNKHVLPLATGGSPNHMLAVDYALRPVLQSLGAHHILSGIYATDAQVVVLPQGGYQLDADISARLDEGIDALIAEALGEMPSVAARFAPVHFSQVRCSV